MQRLRDSNYCFHRWGERERKRETDESGVVVLNGSQINVQNSGIAARPREDGVKRKCSEHTSFRAAFGNIIRDI